MSNPSDQYTLADWMKHAAAATNPAEVERCLERAIAQAGSCHDWRALLFGLGESTLVSRERLTEIANRTLESAREEHDVWGFRDVATVRATREGDPNGARAALEACAAVFREPRTDILGRAAALLGKQEFARGYEWVLLGQGFVESLQDHEGMRRCLEAGRDMARALCNADDLCSVAVEWAAQVDPKAGGGLVLEAETLAKNGTASPWTLANAWRSLGDPAGAARVLGAALQEACSCADALHVVNAWVSHHDLDEARRALARARDRATTADEWLNIGDIAHDAGLGEELVRDAVARAEALIADDEALRNRVASAYKQWLHDDAAATRVGPTGLRPEALRKPARTLAGWETSASGLFDCLRSRISPDALAIIADADYGTGADKHLAALREICESGLVPRNLQWEPHEVLALTRWSSGEGVRHLDRALSCTLLCLAPGDMDELVSTGPILAESCLALGDETRSLAQRFFAWIAETEALCEETDSASDSASDSEPDPGDDISPDHPVALLLLFLLRAAEAPGDPRLETLAHLLTVHPSHDLATVAEWMTDSLMARLWDDLINRILVPARATHSPVASVLRELGR